MRRNSSVESRTAQSFSEGPLAIPLFLHTRARCSSIRIGAHNGLNAMHRRRRPEFGPLAKGVDRTVSVERSSLGPLHPLLHDAETVLRCATQDPDTPQFCTQEKLFELQFEIHSAKVWVFASRTFPLTFRHCLMSFPTKALQPISWCDLR